MDTSNERKRQGRPELSWLKLAIHGGYFLFTLWVGVRFFLFWLWASGKSAAFHPRPPAVEGFLPISGLVSLKVFLLGGGWDPVHPAGLTIFIAAIATSLLFRKGFCGWVCPVGFFSWLAQKAGERLGRPVNPPRFLDYLLTSLKYLLLAFFFYIIVIKMPLSALKEFNRNPYNLAVDARMLLFFLHPSTTAAAVMAALVIGSLFIKNLWCRYLCPYGALLGLLAMFSPTAVRRKEEKCINCRQCDRACPGGIKVSQKGRIASPECVGCLQCAAKCPIPGCIETETAGKRIPAWLIPAGVLALMLGLYLWAAASGHWQTKVPLNTFRNLYPIAERLKHP